MTFETNVLSTSRRDSLLTVFFFLLVFATLILHVAVFFKLNLNLIDSDQPFMWMGASDFAKGLFYEPRYYAQDYNTFMEGLLAVPFIWLGLPVYYAVPIATHVIFLFPFLFTSFYLFFHQKKINALLVFACILCLPADYDLLNSLPRGFVTGLFFTSFFVVSILNPKKIGFVMLNTVLAIVGYFVNPNSVIVSMPVLFYIFLHHYKNPRYYILMIPCLLMIWLSHLFFNQFYITHPDYVMNDLHYRLSTVFFWENISNLDGRFAHISFFFANNCLILLFVLALLLFFFYKRDKKAFASFFVFIAVILFSFCSGKTTEGSTWAYMSSSRMYLGIPVFICMFLSVFEFKPGGLYNLAFCIPLIFCTYKLNNLDRLLAWHSNSKHFHGVRLIPLKDALKVIDFYKDACVKNKVDFLLVSNRFWLNTFLCYGGPAIYEDFPETQETKLEKRYWIRSKNKDKVFKTFLMLSSTRNLDELIPRNNYFKTQNLDGYGLLLVKNNTLKTKDVITLVNAYEK